MTKPNFTARARTSFPILAAFACVAAAAQPAAAQTTVTLPDSSQTTTLTATVSEQARITVPAGVAFAVNDTSSATPAAAVSLTVQNIVMATATKQLRVSLQAEAGSFTPPAAGATTWSAGDVTWNAATWTSATGASGTLSASSYNAVATCAADTASCSTSALVFTLAPNTTVRRSGNHTLVVRWRVEATGS